MQVTITTSTSSVRRVLVPLFVADTDAAIVYTCPGLTYFTLNTTIMAERVGLTNTELRHGSVVGARLQFNGAAVAAVSDLPHVAAVGLVSA